MEDFLKLKDVIKEFFANFRKTEADFIKEGVFNGLYQKEHGAAIKKLKEDYAEQKRNLEMSHKEQMVALKEKHAEVKKQFYTSFEEKVNKAEKNIKEIVESVETKEDWKREN